MGFKILVLSFFRIDSAGHTDVVLFCCGISIQKTKRKVIEGRLKKKSIKILTFSTAGLLYYVENEGENK